ncbi:hypothetical protein TERG_07307 [Paecilomyces variotii No. 5]|uniref:Microbial-type PARG catalytic domain-containing protein n=1 Tax=Byssochlamys spectabilis (strain No. 5 / NBRC 109023) TaxID=1356009 RepID=V5GDV3_BYSSN|nr:hypothetical protein TERG_07307 [Paecilomyces variotii No. 5]
MASPEGDPRLIQTKLSAFYLFPESRKRPASSSAREDSLTDSQQESRDVIDQPSETATETVSSDEWPESEPSQRRLLPKRKRPPEVVQRRRMLSQVAQETKKILPDLLQKIPHAPPKGYLYTPPLPPVLDKKFCPGFLPAEIKVVDEDSFNAAINLAKCSQYMTVRDRRNVCVLNMANAYSAGGGWLNGALAQEEALCYRSSLSFTLKTRYYPLSDNQAIYSPTVVIIRQSLSDGHKLLDLSKSDELPITSVISIAALCQPALTSGALPKYKSPRDREMMKEKMRIILRVAAFNGHRRLVLGAFGCGAFLNPRDEVADCWGEVFSENEFQGGWWESIVFAVLDDLGQGKDGDGNFGVFYRKLHGLKV